MESMRSVQVSVIDFNHRFSRMKERRIESFDASWLAIYDNRQLYVDIPLPRADQFLCRIVERRRLSVGSELAFSGVKQVY